MEKRKEIKVPHNSLTVFEERPYGGLLKSLLTIKIISIFILILFFFLSCFSFHFSGSFAKLRAVFSFRRRLDYHISAVYVPEVILVVLSWCTFFITPTAVPARISLSITTILTTILLSSSVNSNIPKVNSLRQTDSTSFNIVELLNKKPKPCSVLL